MNISTSGGRDHLFRRIPDGYCRSVLGQEQWTFRIGNHLVHVHGNNNVFKVFWITKKLKKKVTTPIPLPATLLTNWRTCSDDFQGNKQNNG